jgi:hypothetical protein
MRFTFNDGGRSASGFKPAGDCVTRAIAIAANLPYMQVFNRLSAGMSTQRLTKRSNKRSYTARNGVTTKRKWFKDYMHELGFRWHSTMSIGSGCTVHLRANELPAGRLVVNVSKHLTAVIDGVINDTYNPDRDGTRCVYGYWIFEGELGDKDAPVAPVARVRKPREKKVQAIEFAVRQLDEYGDTIDTNHFETLDRAKSAAQCLMDDCAAVAVVIEKHITSAVPEDVFKTIFTLGDSSALQEGGWRE